MRSLSEFVKLTPGLIKESAAIRAVLSFCGREGEICPNCEEKQEHGRFYAGAFVKCGKCGKKYSWRTGTIYEGTKLSAAQLVLMFAFFGAGFKDAEIGRFIGTSAATVNLWRFKYNGRVKFSCVNGQSDQTSRCEKYSRNRCAGGKNSYSHKQKNQRQG